MDYKELIEKLRKNLPEKVRYGDLVYEDPFFYEVEEAADAIAELLARVESAEARAQTLEKMVKEYQEDIIPGFKGLLEKAERERDEYFAHLKGRCFCCVHKDGGFDCHVKCRGHRRGTAWEYGGPEKEE